MNRDHPSDPPAATARYQGEAGRHYQESKRAIPEASFPWVARLRAGKLMPWVHAEDTVLEYGVGYGWNLAALRCRRRLGFDVAGFLEPQVRAGGIEFVEDTSALSGGVADVVICHHTLEHTLHPPEVLAEIRRLLRFGGRLLLFVPFERERRYRRFQPDEPNHHLYSWNVQTLGNLVQAAGLKVQTAGVGRFGYDRFAAAWACRLHLGEAGFRWIRLAAHLVLPAWEVRLTALRPEAAGCSDGRAVNLPIDAPAAREEKGAMARIQRALISVYDKTGLLPFAQTLADAGVELISTGGTAKALRDSGLSVTDLSDYTGFPEMLDGRVKTLHPKVHGGLLYLRGNAAHEAAVKEHGIGPIDLVVVNLYPFEQTIARPGVTLDEAIENIDIGGPAMLRSAAKNHEHVTVVMDSSDYAIVAAQIKANGATTHELRRRLAVRVYARTSAYDATIAGHLAKEFGTPAPGVPEPAGAPAKESVHLLPSMLVIESPQAQPLRYGENPHQHAALFGVFHEYFRQLHGKELSYNNILDLTAAANLIAEFANDRPTLAILKHTNPCGVGQGNRLREAWDKAFATDQQAPFGGIIAVNQPLDLACAEAIAEIFSEVIIAPAFQPEAQELLQKKKNLRLIKVLKDPRTASEWEVRSVGAGSFLMQQSDARTALPADLKVVTKRKPTDLELQAMRFGWRVMKHVKSNAIVYSGPDRTLGIGAGQMSRVDASRIAVWKAGEAKLSLKGSVVCSDAFFPFADGLVAAAEAGATAAIQPGGSMRDEEVIAAADKRDLAMVFTGLRHFRH